MQYVVSVHYRSITWSRDWNPLARTSWGTEAKLKHLGSAVDTIVRVAHLPIEPGAPSARRAIYLRWYLGRE
jgi:hypothetical protein